MKYLQTYTINAKMALNRSPIKIQSLCQTFDGLQPISEASPIIEDNQFIVDSGKKWHDIIQFADCFHFAISSRFKEILDKSKFEGWKCFPIEIINHPDKIYYGFFTTNMIGRIANIEAINSYETDIHEFAGSTWKDCDFFSHQGSLSINCKEEVKSIIEKHSISNIEFEVHKIKALF